MRRVVAIAFALAWLGAAPLADAATRTWSGASGTGWNTAGNWVEGIVPANGDDLVFPDNPVSRDSNNDIAGLSIASVSVTTTNSGADYNFTGNGITLAGPITFANPGTGSSGNPVWAIPLTLSAAVTMSSTGRISLVDGTIGLGANTLTLDTAGDIRINGAIAGAGGLTKGNGSALTLAGTNTYTGATLANAGALYIANASALGSTATGTTFAAGAALGTTDGPYSLSEPLTFLGPTNSIFAYSNVDLAGAIAFAGTLTYFAYDPGVISGTVTSTGTLVKDEIDTLSTSGNWPAFTGAVNVVAGGFAPTGTFPAAVNLQAPGSLYGYGTTGLLTMTGGTFAPGIAIFQYFRPAGLASSGGMHNLQLAPGGVPGTSYDQIQVTGGVSLGGTTLNPTSAAPPLPLGLSFIIIDNDGADAVVGTYDGKPEGSTFFQFGNWFSITYVGGDGNDVVLTSVAAPVAGPSIPIPGPGPLALLLASLLLLAITRQRLSHR